MTPAREKLLKSLEWLQEVLTQSQKDLDQAMQLLRQPDEAPVPETTVAQPAETAGSIAMKQAVSRYNSRPDVIAHRAQENKQA